MKATVMMPLCLGMALLTAQAEAAPTIYPVDTARFLGSAKFDFKVEFDRELKESDMDVRINGRSVEDVFGAKPEFIANEEGKGSAILLRNVSLTPGTYDVTAKDGKEESVAKWDVYGTPDMVFGGVGINGHYAFNEPPYGDEPCSNEEFKNRQTRILEVSRETRTINGFMNAGGNFNAIPKYCITVGMKEIFMAKKPKVYNPRFKQSENLNTP